MSETEALRLCTGNCLGCGLEDSCPFPDIPEERLTRVCRQDERKARHAAYKRRVYQADPERVKSMMRASRAANEARLADAQRRIRTVREAHSMTQRTLAVRIGVCTATIANWEHGRRPANWALLRKVFPELEEVAT